MKLFLQIVVAISVLVVQSSFAAGSYHIEALVFTQGSGGGYSDASPSDAPDNGSSWALNTAYLNKYASKLRSSGRYSIVKHTAWGVRSKPYSQSAAHSVVGGGVNGWVKVFAKSLLFAHMDIVVNGRRLKAKRRLKLNEVHYFDNEGFGVLLRVSRA